MENKLTKDERIRMVCVNAASRIFAKRVEKGYQFTSNDISIVCKELENYIKTGK